MPRINLETASHKYAVATGFTPGVAWDASHKPRKMSQRTDARVDRQWVTYSADSPEWRTIASP